ncbi:MAG: tetratricopeptide repeat protein [Acidimicrobiia bacterium]|nr:tetratricopeptide repeat protein [Acidimicrobiia bacterium]
MKDDYAMFRSTKRSLLVIITLALVIKVIVVAQLGDHPMLSEHSGLDTTAYAELAQRVVAGDLLLGPGLYYLSPLYMYVLAGALAVTDSFTGARLIQVSLGAISVGGLWVLTAAWSNTRAAWWAAGLAIMTGVITFYEVLILQASLDFALTTGALLALTWAVRSDGGVAMRWFALAGSAFGLAALNRPNMMAVAAGLVVLLLITRRVRPAAVFLVGLLIALAPVAIRNGVVAGEWFTVTSHGGLNLYIGNSPAATGFYQAVPGVRPTIAGQIDDVREVAGRALGRTVTDDEASAYFRDLALTWMREHPGDAMALFAKKFAYVFHAQYVALPYSYPFYVHETDSWLRWLPSGPWLLMPLGLVGLGLLARRADHRTWVWLSFVPMYAGAVALFFVADRYRLPLLMPMCVGAGILLDACATAVRQRAWTSMAVPAVVTTALCAAVNAPAGLNEGRWEEGLKLAQRLVILGRDDEAAAWVERLAPGAPTPGVAHHLVGGQYLDENKPARAVPYLNAAVEAGLRTPRVLGHLATALQRAGHREEATRVLEQIPTDSTEPPDFWLGLGRIAASLRALTIAERMFGQAVSQAPEDPDARLQHGVNLVLQEKLDEARVQLQATIRLRPRQPDALAYLAFCELSSGHVTEARRLVDAALSIDPTHAVAQSVRAALQ